MDNKKEYGIEQKAGELNYRELGLKCGLEIHQQLDTHKLFCNCPSKIIDDKETPDIIFHRKLLASEGESGEVDIAAREESKKNKTNEYHYYNYSCCLVEMDEEPPLPMNNDALNIVLQISKIFKSNIVDQIQVMRKTVVDGSNTSGFQRTALVSMGGFMEVNNEKIGIETICIEEDAAKIVERKHDKNIYNLSRLGIPLIEIATAPDIKTPEQAREVAARIGMILRSTRRVKRGLGTIRQDLNVSIKNGVRVEIKGVQDLDNIPLLVKNEITRQMRLIELYNKLPKHDIETELVDVSKIMNESESKIVKSILNNNGKFYALKLKGYKGYLGYEIQPGRRYATELADHAKRFGVRGLFHSDELPNYGITENEVKSILKKLECGENDAFIMIGENEEIVKRAFEAVVRKLNSRRLEKEVRQALENGNSSYLRPMPTSSRMYPETDIPPIIPNTDNIEIPELIDDKIIRYMKDYNLNKELATLLAKSEYDFDGYIKNYSNVNPMTIASSLILYPKEIKKRFNININVSEIINEILLKLNRGEIIEDSVKEILLEYGKKGSVNFDNYRALDIGEVEKKIKEIIDNNKDAPIGAIMGMAMKEFRGKVPGKKISEIVNRFKTAK